jgi:hypothetical protein
VKLNRNFTEERVLLGLAGIQAHASQSTPEDEETGRRVSRKRKPKVLYEVESVPPCPLSNHSTYL